jgi:uncharacterized membrane protein YfcA
MNTLEFTAIAAIYAVLAGLLGALTGLGGGVILTPILTLALGVDLRSQLGLL